MVVAAAALLIARLIVGLVLAAHGAQKLFGWFDGPGPKGMAGFMESMNLRPGIFFGLAAGLGEFGGGLLVAAGFLGGLGPGLIIVVMLTAILTVHLGKGFFTSGNGWELPGMYIAGALALDFGGFGAYSLDQAFALTIFQTAQGRWIIVAIAIVLALLNGSMKLLSRPSASAAK